MLSERRTSALNGWPPLTGKALAAIAFLSVGCTVAADWAWFHALEKLEVGVAAMTLFVQPLWGALLSVLLLGETLSLPTVGGGALVLAGLYLALAPGRERWTP